MKKHTTLHIEEKEDKISITINITYPSYRYSPQTTSQFTISFDEDQIISKTYFQFDSVFITGKTKRINITFLSLIMNLNKILAEGCLQMSTENGLVTLKEITNHSNLFERKSAIVISFINRKIASLRRFTTKYLTYFFIFLGEQKPFKENPDKT